MYYTTLYYLEVFKHIYSLLNVFTHLNKFHTKIQLKPSLLRIIVFLPPQTSRSLEKQQRDTLLSDRLEIKGLVI